MGPPRPTYTPPIKRLGEYYNVAAGGTRHRREKGMLDWAKIRHFCQMPCPAGQSAWAASNTMACLPKEHQHRCNGSSLLQCGVWPWKGDTGWVQALAPLVTRKACAVIVQHGRENQCVCARKHRALLDVVLKRGCAEEASLSRGSKAHFACRCSAPVPLPPFDSPLASLAAAMQVLVVGLCDFETRLRHPIASFRE